MADRIEIEHSLSGLRYRPSVIELEKNPEMLERFVKAWRGMLDKPIGDESSFQHIAGIHGKPNPHFCDHRINFFPWHRAYLLMFERALNRIDPGVALPWFDFAADAAQREGLPKSFRSVDEGGIDVLASSPIEVDGGRPSVREMDHPSLPNRKTVDAAFRERNYVSFYRKYYPTVHNALHQFIGGDSASEDYTAYDPSFWIIHCANDRHWWLWQLDNMGANPPRLDDVLDGTGMVVSDVLDINKLGYEYATEEIRIEVGV